MALIRVINDSRVTSYGTRHTDEFDSNKLLSRVRVHMQSNLYLLLPFRPTYLQKIYTKHFERISSLWIIQQTSPWATTCKHRPPSTSLFFPFHIDHVRTNSWCLLRWLRRSLNASRRIRMSNCATRSLRSAYELCVLSFFCYYYVFIVVIVIFLNQSLEKLDI